MTRMLGFCCYAAAGAAATIMAADDANKPSQIVLIKLMVWLPVTACNGPAACALSQFHTARLPTICDD
jgi:hypothetical protein